MNKKKYLTFDAIRFGFRMFRKHCYFIFKLSVITGLLLWGMTSLIYIIHRGFVTHDDLRRIITALFDAISGRLELKDLKAASLLSVFIAILIGFFMCIGDMIGSKIAVMLYDEKDISRKDVISCWRIFPRYFAVSLMCSHTVGTASRLFIGLGFLVEVLFMLCKYFIVDKNTGVYQALNGPWNILKGRILDICMASIIMMIFMIPVITLSEVLCGSIMNNIIAFTVACYAVSTYTFINACVFAFFYRKLLEEKQMQLTPANVIIEDYNQIPKPAQEPLQL